MPPRLRPPAAAILRKGYPSIVPTSNPNPGQLQHPSELPASTCTRLSSSFLSFSPLSFAASRLIPVPYPFPARSLSSTRSSNSCIHVPVVSCHCLCTSYLDLGHDSHIDTPRVSNSRPLHDAYAYLLPLPAPISLPTSIPTNTPGVVQLIWNRSSAA